MLSACHAETVVSRGSARSDTVGSVSENNEQRSRTYTWEDPAPTSAANRDMHGLEFLRGLMDGSIPHHPTSRTLGFTVTDAGEGFAEVTIEPQEYHANAVGSIHGGVLATLFDTAMGFSVASTLEEGVGYTTLDLQVRYIRPVQTGKGVVRVQGFCEHTGGRTATARGEARDAEGRLLATGSTTCMIFR